MQWSYSKRNNVIKEANYIPIITDKALQTSKASLWSCVLYSYQKQSSKSKTVAKYMTGDQS